MTQLLRTATVLRELWYLASTNAPATVFWSYIDGRIRNRLRKKPYLSHQAKFEAASRSMRFSTDWFLRHVPMWWSIFDEYNLSNKRHIEVLEIGSWEGMSAAFLLHSFSNTTVTCVDTWEGGDEHQSNPNVLKTIKNTFHQNLSQFEGRYKAIKLTSFSYFNTTPDTPQFDLIYIDGSHYLDDVLLDAIKGFSRLKPGGIMIFDDYFWRYYPRPIDNPAGAINAFLKLKKGQYKIIRLYDQLVLVKQSSLGPQ